MFWSDVAVEQVNKPELQLKRCETVRVLRTPHLMVQCDADLVSGVPWDGALSKRYPYERLGRSWEFPQELQRGFVVRPWKS